MVLFGTTWCKYSRAFKPIFESTAKQLVSEGSEKINPDKVPVTLVQADCQTEKNLCNRYRVTKYPTVRLFWQGRLLDKEYRGTRNVPSILTHIAHILHPHLSEVVGSMDFATLGHHSKVILGVFTSTDTENYKIFQRTSEKLFDVCHFHYTTSPHLAGISSATSETGEPIIMFKKRSQDRRYTQNNSTDGLLNEEQFLQWATNRCKPLVDEITFENAEGLTEESLPFMILFTQPGDFAIRNEYIAFVEKNLAHEKHRIKFLIADGEKFNIPLKALKKTIADLPVLAIDSFSHIYAFPDPIRPFPAVQELQVWVDDFFTGVLHKNFHSKNLELPPKTEFKKLEPSTKRYSMRARDEL
ncbi:hypothetical protein SARC_02011 [Sphaeroforma arctica JP610]|uniref:Thioredoxin domain-containing protein n=1 Tax=Sphaeroforma arctica JP610 TaxID=667725 RepID=A0A0L0GC39_9EUKA|nr:hypothetical protein SARC_02011 [Sphaeroforma arctica JP610]KNC85828.1 hypothetical protein SARC_02011 [Sphaeroforma arctica JP610]|eukprot:XP_014159730.1 hypothetical protein SARC_02011 [Sphaeroforma arctica JP610]